MYLAFTLLEVLAVVAVVVIVAAIVIPRLRPSGNQRIINRLAAQLPTSARIGTPISGSLTGVANTSVTVAAGGPTWLTIDSLGNYSGIPGGNDFGDNDITLEFTAADGNKYSATQTISVPEPTLSSVTPSTGFKTPADPNGGISNGVDILIAPAPQNGANYQVTFTKRLVRGMVDPLSPIGPETSDEDGLISDVEVTAQFGNDYLSEITIHLRNPHNGETVELGPIQSQPE